MRFSLFYHLDGTGPKIIWSILEGPLVDRTIFKLSNNEIERLQDFFNRVRLPFEKNLQLAFESFELSYENHSIAMNFLSLMIAMEVMLNRGRNELKYSISRNAAVFLGETGEQSKHIFEEVNKLYKKRSDLVHTGSNMITRDDLLKLRKYVRETIKEMYKVGKTKKALTDMLDTCGFGQRPWKDGC